MLLKLAWRNIWRNRRRSIITLGAVVFAALTAIAMRGIQLGTYSLNINSAAELFSGYIQIQAKGFVNNPSLASSFAVDKKIKEALDTTPGVLGYAPRIYADGLISFRDNSRSAMLLGIEPAKEKAVTTFIKNINMGKFFTSDSSNQIVVGYQLLKNLNAKIGDKIVLLAQGYDGALGNQNYEIIGTVKMGVQEIESATIFMGLKSAQSLLAMGSRVNVIAVKTTGLSHLDLIENTLSKKIKDPELRVLPWGEVNPELEQSIQLDNASGILFLGILIVIVAFGILNTVLMSVTERFREFGVLLAIGMPQINLTILVYIETIMIALMGLIIGNLLGYCVNYYLIIHPIALGKEAEEMYKLYHFLPQLNSTVQPSIFFSTSLSILIISVLSCLYPAYKVYRLEPIKGIRHT